MITIENVTMKQNGKIKLINANKNDMCGVEMIDW
jgi:hypothetical protein